jgi:hypothetical protein
MTHFIDKKTESLRSQQKSQADWVINYILALLGQYLEHKYSVSFCKADNNEQMTK